MQRQYQMTKIRPGLWMLPSNDLEWMARLHQREMLKSYGPPERYERVWEVSLRRMSDFQAAIERCHNDMAAVEYELTSGEDEGWAHICYVGTRREAIEEALEAAETLTSLYTSLYS